MRRLLASSLGLGFIPRRIRGSDAGAGTVGAALAIPIALFVENGWVEAVLVAIIVGLGFWAAAPFAEGDPGWVVIDETAGAGLAMIGFSGWPLVVGWVVFRIADITKAFPGVRKAEKLPGVQGLMADDLVAGLYGLTAAALSATLT